MTAKVIQSAHLRQSAFPSRQTQTDKISAKKIHAAQNSPNFALQSRGLTFLGRENLVSPWLFFFALHSSFLQNAPALL
jgi:hypothetical protein